MKRFILLVLVGLVLVLPACTSAPAPAVVASADLDLDFATDLSNWEVEKDIYIRRPKPDAQALMEGDALCLSRAALDDYFSPISLSKGIIPTAGFKALVAKVRIDHQQLIGETIGYRSGQWTRGPFTLVAITGDWSRVASLTCYLEGEVTRAAIRLQPGTWFEVFVPLEEAVEVEKVKIQAFWSGYKVCMKDLRLVREEPWPRLSSAAILLLPTGEDLWLTYEAVRKDPPTELEIVFQLFQFVVQESSDEPTLYLAEEIGKADVRDALPEAKWLRVVDQRPEMLGSWFGGVWKSLTPVAKGVFPKVSSSLLKNEMYLYAHLGGGKWLEIPATSFSGDIIPLRGYMKVRVLEDITSSYYARRVE